MGLLEINVAKGLTVSAILVDEFPPLDQDCGSAGKPVSFRTMVYVQACIELAAMFQVPCLYVFYFMYITDFYLLLGSN
jgi:hypothetical protein